MKAPTGRKASVSVIESAIAASDFPNSWAIAVRVMTTRKKSNASSVQPRKPATTAARWSSRGAEPVVMVLNMRAASLLRTLLFCLLAAAPARAAPPDTLSGRVSDPRGGPVAGAQVALVELARATASGADGRFVFASVPPGRYTVTVRRLGYGAASASVVVPVGAPLEVALHPAPTLVDPITVTATRSPLDRGASPLPADVRGDEPLRRGSTVSLARALEELRGVRSFSSGPQIGKPVVRGLSGARVLVLDDGHRLEDYSWSDEDGPSADARLAERVEVIRGPASLLYGSDAIGGVVNEIGRAHV